MDTHAELTHKFDSEAIDLFISYFGYIQDCMGDVFEPDKKYGMECLKNWVLYEAERDIPDCLRQYGMRQCELYFLRMK